MLVEGEGGYMGELELPKGARAQADDPPEIPYVDGTICPERSTGFMVPGTDALGNIAYQARVIDVACRTDCQWYMPSNRRDKPGECAKTVEARALRTLAARGHEGKVGL